MLTYIYHSLFSFLKGLCKNKDKFSRITKQNVVMQMIHLFLISYFLFYRVYLNDLETKRNYSDTKHKSTLDIRLENSNGKIISVFNLNVMLMP